MKIFMVDMHNTIVLAFSKAFASTGHDLLLAGHSFNSHDKFRIHYGRKWSQKEIDFEIKLPNVKAMEVEELFANPPDVFMVMCAEQQHDQLNIWRFLKPIAPNTKLVFYSGNDGMYNVYNREACVNLLAADVNSYVRCKAEGRHVLYYFPFVDYETFKYTGQSDNLIIRSYINNYQQLFPQGYALATMCASLFPTVKFEWIENRPKSETPGLMQESMATLHAKPLDGYGYAVLESLACGRPVIAYRPWSHERSYTRWVIDQVSGIYFENDKEYLEKLGRFIMEDEYRHDLQKSAAETVRRIVNNEEQSARLKKFLEELV